MIDEGTTVHVIMEVITPVLTGITQVCIITYDRWGYVYSFRDRPFNLQGGLWFFVSFRNFFSDNTRVRIFIFFPEFNIRLYDKNSESDYFFFPPPKSEYFVQQHWESEYFFMLNGHSHSAGD